MSKPAQTLTARWMSLVETNRFSILLVTLALFFFSLPILAELFPARYPRITHVIFTVLFVLSLLAAEFAVSRTQRSTRIAAFLAVPSILIHTINQYVDHVTLSAISHLVSIVFLGFITTAVLAFLFRQDRVTHDTICAALCVYLLMGVLWAILYSLIAHVEPRSFHMSATVEAGNQSLEFGGGRSDVALYYSFVTITTLGYGDITPATSVARILSASEALVGQLFLAVLVARLVGMHISQSAMRKLSSEENQDEPC